MTNHDIASVPQAREQAKLQQLHLGTGAASLGACRGRNVSTMAKRCWRDPCRVIANGDYETRVAYAHEARPREGPIWGNPMNTSGLWRIE